MPGDDPDCPYIMLCAPTGSAAVNINGSTLHSAFGFTFGNEHYSLPDKTRNTKRNLYRNLKFLVIDEISMVKADQLYQLDLRSREITTRSVWRCVNLAFRGCYAVESSYGYIYLEPATK